MTDNYERQFKGVWIPAEIYLHPDLSWTEKILFTEICSLDGENGCYASNEYLAKFLNVGKQTITNSISKLKKIGLIEEASYNGRQRVLKVTQLILRLKENLYSDLPKNYSLENFTSSIINKEKIYPVKSENQFKRTKRPLQKSPVKILPDVPSSIIKFSREFLHNRHKEFPMLVKKKDITQKKILDGVRTIDQLIKIDRYDFEKDIRPTIEWAMTDIFWAPNLLSLASLRKKGSNGQTKFVNMLASRIQRDNGNGKGNNGFDLKKAIQCSSNQFSHLISHTEEYFTGKPVSSFPVGVQCKIVNNLKALECFYEKKIRPKIDLDSEVFFWAGNYRKLFQNYGNWLEGEEYLDEPRSWAHLNPNGTLFCKFIEYLNENKIREKIS